MENGFKKFRLKEETDLLKSKSSDMDEEPSTCTTQNKETLSNSHQVNNTFKKEEPILKEKILSHFAPKYSGVSVGNGMKIDSKCWGETNKNLKLKSILS